MAGPPKLDDESCNLIVKLFTAWVAEVAYTFKFMS